MALVEGHISKVGAQSGDKMKFMLHEFLRERYQSEYPSDFSGKLAAAVANYIFCEHPQRESQSFAIENETLIEAKARELSQEVPLCKALTCAVYNYCYGKYVDSGRKVGMLFAPFLGFVRGLQEVMNGREPTSFLDVLYPKVGYENVKPLVQLWLLGLYRPLPRTPDSKLMMEEIVRFGKSIGSSVVK